MNLPNVLTLVRIALIPVFAVVYLATDAYFWIASLLFGAAAFTDWLDGYLARRLNQSTPIGAFLDPVADKLIVSTALALLIASHGDWLMTIPGTIIIGREIVISALREWMAEMNRRGVVAVTWWAQLKTATQMIAIAVLLGNPPTLENVFVLGGLGLLYFAALLTIISMVSYLRAAWPSLREGMRPVEE